MDEKIALRALKIEATAISEALANAIALWASSVSDADSLRFKDLLRLKTRAVLAFFAHSKKAVHEVTPLDVKAWREYLEQRQLAQATIYCRLSFLSSFYQWAMTDPTLGRHILTNPVRMARPKAPKAYQTESSKALSDEQLGKLQGAIKARADQGQIVALRDYALFLMYVMSGMRRSEVINLRGQDLEFREEGIVVTCRVKGGDYIGRMISNPAVRAALENYLVASGRMDLLKKGGPLWTRHDQAGQPGAALSGWSFVKRMKLYAREAGLEHFHLHQTRHTFARIVAESSGSIIETQDALGHRNPATTRVYVQRIAIKRDKFGDEIARRLKL
ncbi:MAG: tyrosine-type recombinase/integrase [Blastocatellia bacterium]